MEKKKKREKKRRQEADSRVPQSINIFAHKNLGKIDAY